MGHDRKALKRPLNVSLNEDLVRQARRFTTNLSATLEDLLQGFVSAQAAEFAARDAATARLIDGFNHLHEQHGLLSDEFSGF
jgi:antitoxin CcdA